MCRERIERLGHERRVAVLARIHLGVREVAPPVARRQDRAPHALVGFEHDDLRVSSAPERRDRARRGDGGREPRRAAPYDRNRFHARHYTPWAAFSRPAPRGKPRTTGVPHGRSPSRETEPNKRKPPPETLRVRARPQGSAEAERNRPSPGFLQQTGPLRRRCGTQGPRDGGFRASATTAERAPRPSRDRFRRGARYLPSTTGMGASSASSRFPSHT